MSKKGNISVYKYCRLLAIVAGPPDEECLGIFCGPVSKVSVLKRSSRRNSQGSSIQPLQQTIHRLSSTIHERFEVTGPGMDIHQVDQLIDRLYR